MALMAPQLFTVKFRITAAKINRCMMKTQTNTNDVDATSVSKSSCMSACTAIWQTLIFMFRARWWLVFSSYSKHGEPSTRNKTAVQWEGYTSSHRNWSQSQVTVSLQSDNAMAKRNMMLSHMYGVTGGQNKTTFCKTQPFLINVILQNNKSKSNWC